MPALVASVLALVPLFAWLGMFMCSRLWRIRRGSAPDWRVEFLWACLAWGVAVTVITETLSSLRLITRGGVGLAWILLAAIVACPILLSLRRARGLPIRMPVLGGPWSFRLVLGGILLIGALTGLTAIVAPPNNYDAFLYHMSRVMHWIQNRSVDFYATHIVWQLYHPPWTEYVILQFQVLSGGDYLANLTQWFSMAGSLIGVTLIARELGANAEIQLYAAAICASIPMGILQSSTVKNDYAASFWLVCLAYFCLRLMRQERTVTALGGGASLGLGLLTKATSYVFAFSFLLWYCLAALTSRRKPAVASFALMAVLTLALNLPHYYRNDELFGAPLGPSSVDKDGQYDYTNAKISLQVTTLNAVKNLALHLGTPFAQVNAALEQGVTAFAGVLGLDVNDPAIHFQAGRHPFLVRRPSTHEAHSGNFVHLVFALAALVALPAARGSWQGVGPRRLAYLGAVVLAFLAFVSYVKWQIWGSHHHLPLFVLASPAIALALAIIRSARIRLLLVLGLLSSALPWALANELRPLVAWPGLTSRPSLLTVSRSQAYFLTVPEMEQPFRSATALIAESGCSDVGLSGGLEELPEYLVWVLLREGGRLPRIEHYGFEWDRPNPSKRLATPFVPCAVFNVWYDDSLASSYAEAIGGEVHQFGNVYAVVPK
jgi:4-amino-4-deoxy-L-arabinose transferase-like glycosyltransferase